MYTTGVTHHALIIQGAAFKEMKAGSSVALPTTFDVAKSQIITVRNVDLSTDDVTRLRRAWVAHASQQGESSALPDTTTGRENNLVERPAEVGDTSTSSDLLDVRLVFGGKDLQEGKPLRSYNIARDSTVHVHGRLRGGAQLGKVVKGRSQVRQIAHTYDTRGKEPGAASYSNVYTILILVHDEW